MSKSHVSMEIHICKVCGHKFHTGNLLLDKELKQRLGRDTLTGYGLCNADQQRYNDGYLALIEISNAKDSSMTIGNTIPDRTGTILHIRREVFNQMFSHNKVGEEIPMIFIDTKLCTKLKELVK